MPSNLTCLRVFIASPGGLAEERKAFRDEINEYNEAEAIPRGVLFQPMGWEDTLGGVGRPQTIINEDICKADYFVLVLWNRWGSPPDTSSKRFTSGTEEEYYIALECHGKQQMRQLVLMFKSVDPAQLSDPGLELQKVLRFREKIEQQKTHLFQSFDTTENFRKITRRHLAAWLRNQENGGAPQEQGPPIIEPGIGRILSEATFQQLPESFDKSLTAKAWELANEGRLTEAEIEFSKTVVGRQRPQALLDYGKFLFRLGRLDQAKVLFQGAVTVSKDQKNPRAVATAYGSLGNVLEIRGDLAGAEQMYRKALDIDEKLGHLEGLASMYLNLGNVLEIQGDLAGAEQMYRKALDIDEKLGHLGADTYSNLGNVFQVRGDLAGAEQMYRKALDIDEKLGRIVEGQADTYSNLGNVFQVRGDLAGAEQMYRKALDIDEKLGRLEGLANTYLNLGNVFQVRGDLAGAEQMYRKALDIDEKLGRLEGLANTYLSLGNVFQVREDLAGAEQMYRKALEINEKLGRLEGLANTYLNLGNVFQVRGNMESAEQFHAKALEAAERLGSLSLITRMKSLLPQAPKPT